MRIPRLGGPLGALALLAGASAASAAQIVVPDSAGRPMTFEVEASGVDVAGYARILSSAAHGDEITRVSLRIIPVDRIHEECGVGASACYRATRGGASITVPASGLEAVRAPLLHEYGHHVDSSIRHQPGACSDGTPRWWQARAVASLLARGALRCDYGGGWGRSVAEVFAEDYRVLNVPGSVSRGASGQPGAAVLDALRRDLLQLAGAVPSWDAPPARGAVADPPPRRGAPRLPAAPVRPVPTSLRPGARLRRSGGLRGARGRLLRVRLARPSRITLAVRTRPRARPAVVRVVCAGRNVAVGRSDGRAVLVLRTRARGTCTARARTRTAPLRWTAILRVAR